MTGALGRSMLGLVLMLNTLQTELLRKAVGGGQPRGIVAADGDGAVRSEGNRVRGGDLVTGDRVAHAGARARHAGHPPDAAEVDAPSARGTQRTALVGADGRTIELIRERRRVCLIDDDDTGICARTRRARRRGLLGG